MARKFELALALAHALPPSAESAALIGVVRWEMLQVKMSEVCRKEHAEQ